MARSHNLPAIRRYRVWIWQPLERIDEIRAALPEHLSTAEVTLTA